MSGMTIEFKWNPDVGKRVEDMQTRGRRILKEETARGMNDYVPMQTGDLAKSVNASISTDDPYLVYTAPYAETQYHKYPKKSTNVHPMASMKWFEVWKAADGETTIERVKKRVKL